jgi:hypothetical protein
VNTTYDVRPGTRPAAHATDSATAATAAAAQPSAAAVAAPRNASAGDDRVGTCIARMSDHSRQARCEAVRDELALCARPSPRECLATRVPWRTPLKAVSCCFHCCLMHWTERLGLRRNYDEWLERATWRTWWSKALAEEISEEWPPLDEVS